MEAHEGRDICIIMTGSHCCMAETNTKLQSNFQPIKKINNLKKNFHPILQEILLTVPSKTSLNFTTFQ